MKKYVLLLLLISGPLRAQEKQIKYKYLEYKRPVFGLNVDIGYSYNLFSRSGLSTGIAPEFYLGKKHKVYFYLQFSLGYQYYPYISYDHAIILTPAFSSFYFGTYIGLGGYILEASNGDPWSVVMNGAVGGQFLFTPVQHGTGYNATSIGLGGEGISFYLDFILRKHISRQYAVQFGPFIVANLMFPSMTIDINFKVGLVF